MRIYKTWKKGEQLKVFKNSVFLTSNNVLCLQIIVGKKKFRVLSCRFQIAPKTTQKFTGKYLWTLARLHVSESFTDSVLTGDMRNSHCHSWHLGICLRAVSFFSHIFGAISFVQIFSCMNGQAGIAFIFGFNKVWCRLCPWGYGGIIVGQPAAAAGVGKGGKKNSMTRAMKRNVPGRKPQ